MNTTAWSTIDDIVEKYVYQPNAPLIKQAARMIGDATHELRTLAVVTRNEADAVVSAIDSGVYIYTNGSNQVRYAADTVRAIATINNSLQTLKLLGVTDDDLVVIYRAN